MRNIWWTSSRVASACCELGDRQDAQDALDPHTDAHVEMRTMTGHLDVSERLADTANADRRHGTAHLRGPQPTARVLMIGIKPHERNAP